MSGNSGIKWVYWAFCLALTGQVASASNADTWSEKGDGECKAGQYQLSIEDYTKAIQEEPQTDKYYVLRAIPERMTGKFKEFFADISHAIQLNPDNVEPYILRAQIYDLMGNFPSAVSDYSAALKINPTYSDSLYARGLDKIKLGDMDGAVADFSQAIQNKPEMVQAYLGRGAAYQLLGNDDLAIADYDSILKLNPDALNVHIYRASAFDGKGDDVSALSELDNVLAKDSTLQPAHLERGFIYFRQGKDANALNEVQTFVDNTTVIFKPETMMPLFMLWILQVDVNHDIKTADLELRHFGPPLSNSNSERDWSLVMAHCFLGQATDADVFKAVGSGDPTLAAFYLGMKHIAQGDKATGIALLLRVVNAKLPGSPEVRIAKARLEMLK